MPKSKTSFTELTYQVVQASRAPLPFDEILRRVQAITPITTKNPRSTIRNAVSQARLIVATGDGRYGWKPRLITGSVLRLTLSESDLSGQGIEFGDDLREALWPAFFEVQKRHDTDPIHLQLPDQQVTDLPLTFFGQGRWGTVGAPPFWAWFTGLSAAPGDHLIFRVLDGDAKRHAVAFEPRAARDEAVIAVRNREIIAAALDCLRRSRWGLADWDLAAQLLATGRYRHPVPPDPLAQIWTKEVWGPELEKKGPYTGPMWVYTGPPQASFGAEALREDVVDDRDSPRDLPREYDPDQGRRRPRASRKAKQGPVKTYTLRVSHRALPRVWRDIELAEDQTLEDLHLMIQRAYHWSDDHLYSFFMSGQPWDKETEIGCPWSEAERHTHQAEIGRLGLEPRQKFLYLFDYGDNHEFDVEVLCINPSASKGSYPKIVARAGKAPAQYPAYDEATGEPEWNPYAHWEE